MRYSMLILQCPHCRIRLRIPEKLAGRRGKCPKCRGAILAPARPIEESDRLAAEILKELDTERPFAASSLEAEPTPQPKPASAGTGTEAHNQRKRRLLPWVVGGFAVVGLLVATVIAAIDIHNRSTPLPVPRSG